MMNWVVIIIGVMLAAFAAYKEIVRVNRARLALRVVAVLVSVMALACLILPVSYKSVSQSNSGSVVLLTPGFDKDSLTAYNQPVYTLDSDVAKAYPKAKLSYSPAEIAGDSSAKTTIHIYGNGLDNNALKQIGGSNIILHPSPIPEGITAISWTKTINSGLPLQVQGTIKNTGKPILLLLKGLSTVLDSVKIAASSSITFSLSSMPKHPGRVIYNLVGVREKDTLFNEELPVIIQPAQPLKVLMLAASPGFENKFLRNWLGNNNYAVASRALVSKNKFGQDYVNMERTDLSHITAGLLSHFDVVEADLSALKMLSPAENSALQQEVSSKGLGLVVRADTVDNKNTSWVQSGFRVVKSPKQPAAELLIQGKKTAKINLDAQYIAQQNNIQSIVNQSNGNQLAAVTLSGAGKVIFSTINNSYSWMLAGDNDDYSALWSALIGKAARKALTVSSWSVASDFPSPGEPVTLVYHGASPAGFARINEATVAPVQNAGIPFEYSFNYWPAKVGWQQALVTNNAPFYWFVWPKNSFNSVKATQYARITSEYARKSTKYASFSRVSAQKVSVEISKFYFYILFLVAAVFLWAENKYSTIN